MSWSRFGRSSSRYEGTGDRRSSSSPPRAGNDESPRPRYYNDGSDDEDDGDRDRNRNKVNNTWSRYNDDERDRPTSRPYNNNYSGNDYSGNNNSYPYGGGGAGGSGYGGGYYGAGGGSSYGNVDVGGGGNSAVVVAAGVPYGAPSFGWAPPQQGEGAGPTPPMYINTREVNVYHGTPPGSSPPQNDNDRDGRRGGFFRPAFEAAGDYIDRRFGLNRD